MSDQKIKTAADKCPLNLIPLSALKGAARVFGYGAKKYAAGNFHTAEDDGVGDRYVGGFLRHLADAQRPDGLFDDASLAALDAESGLPEIDHALCGLIMLRTLLVKRGALPADPGIGNDPPARVRNGASPHIHTGKYNPDGSIKITCGHDIAAGEGISVEIDPNDLARQPVDVHAPSIYPEGDPAGVRPFRDGLGDRPYTYTTEAVRAAERCGIDPAAEDPRCPAVRRLLGQFVDATGWLKDVDRERAEHGLGPWHPVDDEAARAAQAIVDGATGRGPRFVVVKAEHVPEGAVAEFFRTTESSDWPAVARRYNTEHCKDFDPRSYSLARHHDPTSVVAIVDTQPEKGGYHK